MTDKPRVVLIDLSSLFWTAYMVNSENGVREPRAVTLANVKRCVQPGELVAICCDSGKSFRKEISADYKAQREKQPEAAYGELNKTKERLRSDGYLLWSADGFEADDIISTATKAARDRGHEVRIASADKDLLALLGPGVDALRTHTWTVVDSRQFLEKFKIDPNQMTDFLALKGDSSDNIPGCPGIGDVRAAELLTKFETLDRIYEALDAGKQVSTPANEKSLRENRAQVELSRKLVELRFDVPIRFEEIYEERKVQPLTTTTNEMPTDGDPGDEEKTADSVQSVSASGDSTPPTTAPLAQNSNGTTALTVVAPVEYERQLEPRSLRAAVWLGQHLFDSRLYQKFTTPEAITAVIIRGRELGLGATTSLDVFHVIEGKPSPYAYLMIARAKAHPDCEYFYLKDGASAESAMWVTKNRRNPVETSVTYTFEQAKIAKLVKPGSAWEKHPEDQVVKTAGAKLARREYPDAALGLYAVVELGGDE